MSCLALLLQHKEKPILKHSGNGGSDVYAMVYYNVCVTSCMFLCLCLCIVYVSVFAFLAL